MLSHERNFSPPFKVHSAVCSAAKNDPTGATGLGQDLVSANVIYLATIWALPVIIAITFHEAAHGFVAHLLGDDTAWRLGRVSFNPLKHVDSVGTILLPGILLLLQSPFMFGYAKPVPRKFSCSELATTRHGPGRCSRAGDEHRARYRRGSGVPYL
jgi:hypothetical protein